MVKEHNYKAKNFMIWLFLFSSFMFFAALVSAFMVQIASSDSYLVKREDYPSGFIYSTILILLSSLTMHLAVVKGKNALYQQQKKYLLLTFILGIGFLISQFLSWKQLITNDIFLVSVNAGDSFIYVFTGFHLLHVVAGLLFILYSLFGIQKKISVIENNSRLYKCSTFWHFIDIIWIYLYLFLLLY